MASNLVFHYCNVATALSILNNKEIWMTSIRNMNDANESIGVYGMFFELLRKYDAGNSLDAMYRLALTSGMIQLYENPPGAYPEYVTCFSAKSDLVSQWISYADGGRGLAIGFDEEELSNIASGSGGALEYQKITYVSEENIQKHIPSIYRELECCSRVDGMAIMDKAMEQIKKIYPFGIRYKTIHYESECETRLVYRYGQPSGIVRIPHDWEISSPRAYAKRNMINTYVSLHFPQTAIKKIMLGPQYQRNFHEIELALEAMNYTGLEIEQSGSGYR